MLYSGDLDSFREDVINNKIADILKDKFYEQYGRNISRSEYGSWQNSLRVLKDVFEYNGLNQLHTNKVVLEYRIPVTDRRIDALVFSGNDGMGNIMLIELKQWSNESVKKCDDEGNVYALINGNWREVEHPSFQVEGYYYNLKDNLKVLEDEPGIKIHPAVYCHNYSKGGVLYDPEFEKAIQSYPVFSKEDYAELGEYIRNRLIDGDGREIYNRFLSSPIKPSKKLVEYMGKMIDNQQVFNLIDEQIAARNAIISRAKRASNGKKTVIIVSGGPGTGKTVIALETMVELLNLGKNVFYATGSSAFTNTLRKLVGNRAKGRIKYFFNFTNYHENEVDAIICDEAHRLRADSNDYGVPAAYKSKRPQVEDIIGPAKLSVFFIDEKQVVRPGEVGSISLIENAAKKFNADVVKFELESQFRCGGSDSYIKWLENVLQISNSDVSILKEDEPMEFRIFDDPVKMRDEIYSRNREKQNSARIVAGFCWKWSDADPNGRLVEDVVIGNFRMPWEAGHQKTGSESRNKFWKWATDPSGMERVGTVYAAQGFEFDYVGVIFGNDLVYNPTWGMLEGKPENSFDPALKRDKKHFTERVKNIYRVLLSRAHRGVYVYFVDKETELYFKSKIERYSKSNTITEQ